MIFNVDLKKRRSLINEVKRIQKKRLMPYKIGYVSLTLIFLVAYCYPVFFMIKAAYEAYRDGYIGDAFILLSWILLPTVVLLFLMAIPLKIKEMGENKHVFCATRTKEKINLNRRSIEHSYYGRGSAKYYISVEVKYEDIIRIERDDFQHCIRIYGAMTYREWFSFQKEKLLMEKKPKDLLEWDWEIYPTMAIFDYLQEDSFENLIEELEERTKIKAIPKVLLYEDVHYGKEIVFQESVLHEALEMVKREENK